MSLLQIKGDLFFLDGSSLSPYLALRRELERLSRQGRRTRGISEPREVLFRFITLMDGWGLSGRGPEVFILIKLRRLEGINIGLS